MPQFVFGNFFETELVEGLTPSSTTILVSPSMTLELPAFALGSDQQAQLTLWDGILPPEIVTCTENPQTGALTVVRAQEDTTAQAWGSGTQIRCALTAEVINQALAAYFDINVVLNAAFLKLAGGTLTGPLILNADPTQDLGAATKHYVDNSSSGALFLTGGTMQGTINMNNNRIIQLLDPISSQEPATKNYADSSNAAVLAILMDRSGILDAVSADSLNYTVTTFATYASLADGLEICVKPNFTNVAGIPRLVITSNAVPFASTKIRQVSGVDLVGGELQANTPYTLVYNAVGNELLIKDQAASINLSGYAKVAGDTTLGGKLTVTGLPTFNSTDHVVLPGGTTAQRNGTPTATDIRRNTDFATIEEFNGTSWISMKPVMAPPCGRLTLVSGQPFMSGDVSAAVSVFYTPRFGNLLSIYDSVDFVNWQISELTLALGGSHSANGIYDIFASINAGAVAIGTGPAWQNAGAGTGARGTGAATTELELFNGVYVNKVSMNMLNGVTAWTVPARQARYLGSIYVDNSAGHVTAHFTYGKSRKNGLWNLDNKGLIYLKAGETAASYTIPGPTTNRPFNNDTANSLTTFTGLAEEPFDFNMYAKFESAVSNSVGTIGFGINSTTVMSGPQFLCNSLQISGVQREQSTGKYLAPLSLGINTITGIENTTSTTMTMFGTEVSQGIMAQWRG